MRSIDLSLYADRLAGEAASLAARIEREHGRLRQGAIERAARGALAPFAVERLEALGLLRTSADPVALAELEETLDALEALEAWVEEALARAAGPRPDRSEGNSWPARDGPPPARAQPEACASAVPRRGVSATSSPPSAS
jgi:hypothetical protein